MGNTPTAKSIELITYHRLFLLSAMMMECTEYERALIDEIMCRAQCGECFNSVFFKNLAETPGVVTAACLSQWYPSEFELEGQRYVHAEQYMMAEKARLFADLSTLHALLQTT